MNRISGFALSAIILFALFACESEKRIPPRGYLPVTPQATESLEAAYFWIAQDKVTSGYWTDAPYLEVNLEDIEVGNLYADGYLNMTGTYDGTSDFNRGRDPELRIKAGYDEEYIYIFVEWNDTTLNPSYMKRLFEGPADPLKQDSSSGWTSQGNEDSFRILFDVDGSPAKDTWKWSMATTAPFNMALNLSTSDEGELIGNNPHLTRNGSPDSSRAAPALEWNGERQEITLADGSTKSIDPAYFLLEDFTTPYTGNPETGRHYFNETASCSFCHGPDGNGEPEIQDNDEGPLQFPIAKTRSDLIEFIKGHPGGAPGYFGQLHDDPEKENDLIAFLRGIGGLPGYIMGMSPAQSDIQAQVNVGTAIISSTRNSRYQVLLKRKLVNTHPEDVQFSPENRYTFSILLSDDDDLNAIGASGLELVFKSNEL